MPTDDELKKYREFVDGLVARREGVLTHWVREKGWPRVPENGALNALLDRLTPDERELLSGIATEARDSGIHDTLVYIQERIDLGGLRLVDSGTELPSSPYGTELFWDWTARVGGMNWPPKP